MKSKLSLFLICCSLSYCNLLEAQHLSTNEIDVLYDKAIRLYVLKRDSSILLNHKVFELSESNNYKLGIVKAKLLSAFYYSDLYQLDTAKILLNSSLAYFATSEHNNSFLHGKALYYFGKVCVRSQELYTGVKHAKEALEIFNSISDIKYVGNTLTLLGGLEMSRSNYSNALDYFSRAYKIKLENGNKMEDCISEMFNISIVYSRMGQYDNALKLANNCLSIAQRMNDVERMVNILNSIGTYHNSLKQYDSAFYYYRECKQISLGINNTRMAYLAEYNIANMLSNNGEYQRANEIMEILHKSDYVVSPSMIDVSQTLKAKNYLKLGKYDESILLANNVLKKVAKQGNKQTLINIVEIIEKAYRNKQQMDSAYHYLNLLYVVKDSVYNIGNQRKLSTLYAELESAENESKIQKLELDQFQSQVRTTRVIGVSSFLLLFFITSFIIFRVRQRKKQKLLEFQLDISRKKLSAQMLSMIHRNNAFEEIELELQQVRSRCNGNADPGINKIQKAIQLNKSLDSDWEYFSMYFTELHGDFLDYLKKNSGLSDYELRLCALVKLKLTNKEIASILNIEHKSVKMAKYRLKKKLNLQEDKGLDEYIDSIS